MTVTWDPAQYGKFAEQRMRPVADLLARITLDAPEAIYDLGCGDGRVLFLLDWFVGWRAVWTKPNIRRIVAEEHHEAEHDRCADPSDQPERRLPAYGGEHDAK